MTTKGFESMKSNVSVITERGESIPLLDSKVCKQLKQFVKSRPPRRNKNSKAADEFMDNFLKQYIS